MTQHTENDYMVRGQAKSARVKVVFEEGLGLTNVEEYVLCGDKSKLGQVFRNLMSNALKFTPPGGVVRVRASELVPMSNDPSSALDAASAHAAGGPSPATSPKKGSVTVVPAVEPSAPSTHQLVIEVCDSGAGISLVSRSDVLFGSVAC